MPDARPLPARLGQDVDGQDLGLVARDPEEREALGLAADGECGGPRRAAPRSSGRSSGRGCPVRRRAEIRAIWSGSARQDRGAVSRDGGGVGGAHIERRGARAKLGAVNLDTAMRDDPGQIARGRARRGGRGASAAGLPSAAAGPRHGRRPSGRLRRARPIHLVERQAPGHGPSPCRLRTVAAGIRRAVPAAIPVAGPDKAASGPRSASNVETPMAGTPRASARPRAAATAMRMPVKLPGPDTDADGVSVGQGRAARRKRLDQERHQPFGLPFAMGPRGRSARTRSPDSKAAAQCAADVSKPRTGRQTLTGRTSSTSGM
jgi:hypothetical protein